VNRTCAEFTGLPIERLHGEGWLDVVHPDDRDRCVSTYAPAFETRVPFLLEYRARRADGVYRWLLAHGVPMHGPDGAYSGFLGADVDITERREAEERIRESRAALEVSHRAVQQLAGRLIEAQDAERARLARDLHDDVSQQLAGLSIAISGLRHRMEERRLGADVVTDLHGLQERTSLLAQNVRHLSHDLHPTVLRHVGLADALKAHCAELERVHGTPVHCSADGDFSALAPEIALCLYRIAQEALRNVVAHAQAQCAQVWLLCAAADVELTISDDGRGFDVAATHKLGKGLGLVSLGERARIVGGTVDIQSEPTKGTCIHVQMPLRAAATRTYSFA
jgi:PAS domain S-box-containing protein